MSTRPALLLALLLACAAPPPAPSSPVTVTVLSPWPGATSSSPTAPP